MSGQKIIDGLKDAVAGNFTRVTIDGQTWVRRDVDDADRGQMRVCADNLIHAITTASNDDYSKPGTQERERYTQRITVMGNAVDLLRRLADPKSPGDA